jgi:hypothetical protein
MDTGTMRICARKQLQQLCAKKKITPLVLNCVLVGAFPDLIVFAAIEIGLFVLVLVHAWKYFLYGGHENSKRSAEKERRKTSTGEPRTKHDDAAFSFPLLVRPCVCLLHHIPGKRLGWWLSFTASK